MDKTPVLFYREGTCALGALISLLWSGEAFRLCHLQESDETNPDYLKLNALGEVPTLFTDGVVISENVAILQHIGFLNLSPGITFEPGSGYFDQLQRALGFLSSSFHKSFMPIFSPELFHEDKKVQTEMRQKFIAGHLREMMEHTEIHLLRTPLLFDHPTVGDAYLYAMVRWTEDLYNLPKEFPHLVRFQKAMNQLPEVALALRIESGQHKDGVKNFKGHVEFKDFVRDAAHRKRQLDHAGWDEEMKKVLPVAAQLHALQPHRPQQGLF